MELSIRKYCYISPRKISRNGLDVFDTGNHESPEKSLAQTYRMIGLDYLKFFKMDNLSKLAILAAECVLKDTELYGETANENVAVVLANTSSSLVTDSKYQQTISDPENYFPSPSLFVYTLPNIAIGEICIRFKIYGSNMFFVSKQFDPETVHLYVNDLFGNPGTEYCLTGWVECNDTDYEAFVLLIEKKPGIMRFDSATLDFLYNSNK